MSIPNEINRAIIAENNVYFYPEQIKITYSSLEDLKDYLDKIFAMDSNLEEKLQNCKKYILEVLKSLYQQGVIKKDNTMVVTDVVVKRELFQNILEHRYQSIFQNNIKKYVRNKLDRFKSRLLLAIFIQKERPIRDFFSLLKVKNNYYSDIYKESLNLIEISQIKFLITKELEEFIVNFLTRKALLSNGCSVYTLRMYLPVIIELIIFYAKAISLINKKDQVDSETLLESIRTVDSHYITDIKFIKQLQSKSIGNFLEFINL